MRFTTHSTRPLSILEDRIQYDNGVWYIKAQNPVNPCITWIRLHIPHLLIPSRGTDEQWDFIAQTLNIRVEGVKRPNAVIYTAFVARTLIRAISNTFTGVPKRQLGDLRARLVGNPITIRFDTSGIQWDERTIIRMANIPKPSGVDTITTEMSFVLGALDPTWIERNVNSGFVVAYLRAIGYKRRIHMVDPIGSLRKVMYGVEGGKYRRRRRSRR